MTTHADLINTGSLRESVDGTTVVTEYMVTDVTGNTSALRTNALAAAGIPKLHDPHGTVPGISVIDREVIPVPDSPHMWIVRVTFESPRPGTAPVDPTQPFGEMTWSGSVRSEVEEVLHDADGNPLIVQYRGRPVLEQLDPFTGEVTSNNSTTYGYFRYSFVHNAELERPLMTLNGTRWERDDPESKAARYQGHTNQVTWRGYAPETMLIREIGFDPNTEFGGWDVRYTFVYDRKTWRLEKSLKIASSIGFQTPQDATLGNGIERFKMFPTLPFSVLAV